MDMGKRFALVAGMLAAFAASAAVATPAGAAPVAPPSAEVAAESCTDWRDIRTSGNSTGLRYRECDRGSGSQKQTKAQIYLWDNKHDGKIAQAHVVTGWGKGGIWYTTWRKYYGWGDESRHSPLIDTGWHSGHDVKVTLAAVRG
ncbi:hypothetical protein ACIRL2_19185 [Embleya sp. NPDC127516]|uniref:hypothetical protein n=1 Tax=Embleya sp. NPDC127516 TaxID=3363990 RepID=UPI00381E333A